MPGNGNEKGRIPLLTRTAAKTFQEVLPLHKKVDAVAMVGYKGTIQRSKFSDISCFEHKIPYNRKSVYDFSPYIRSVRGLSEYHLKQCRQFWAPRSIGYCRFRLGWSHAQPRLESVGTRENVDEIWQRYDCLSSFTWGKEVDYAVFWPCKPLSLLLGLSKNLM